MDLPSPYFLQSRQWADFWLKANEFNHEIHQIRCQVEINGQPVGLAAFVYKYPWHLGQNFLYIPKGPFLQKNAGVYLSKSDLAQLLSSFLKEIDHLAKSLKSAFIKIDFDDNLTQALGLTDNQALENYLQATFKYHFNFDSKKLQYLQTPVLRCSSLKKTDSEKEFSKPNRLYLKQFFDLNTDFWSRVNQNTRRGTRKSLEEDWFIDTDKTLPNFEAFWQLIKDTGTRQHFKTHPQEYYQQLFDSKISRIIILRDDKGKAQTVWMGIAVDGVLTYLYGGNSFQSRKTNSQYLVHLVALDMASREGCRFYDLGGYDPDKGYGKFKEGYRGQIRTFLGPVDLITRKFHYNLINGVIHWLKSGKIWLTKLFTGRLKITELLFKFTIGLLITTCLPFWIFTLMAYWPSNVSINSDDVNVAIVFGASVDFVNLKPSSVLQKRLDKAVELYTDKKIRTILVSGDNREVDYNEPFVMKKYLIDKGLPSADVVEDFGGRRTLDTCWRAKNVFKADRVYLVTQRFHLPRTDFNCRQVGLETVLAPADDSNFSTTFWGIVREIPASWLAVQEALRGYEPPVKSDGTETEV